MSTDEASLEMEELQRELLSESQQYHYPHHKQDVRMRYRDVAHLLYKKWKLQDLRPNFLSLGSRRSSTVSNYGNTPIVMRRSISSNGELAPYAVQGAHFGSLRGVPAGFAEQEAKYNAEFGSLRGLSTVGKRLSKFDENEELQLKSKPGDPAQNMNGNTDKDRLSDTKSSDDWDTTSVAVVADTKTRKGRGGLSKQASLDERQNDKDKWRDDAANAKRDERINSKGSKQDVRKSSESLISTKRKKPWWFRRKKSVKDSSIPTTPEEPKIVVQEADVCSERISMTNRAASDVNLKIEGPDDNRSLHEELRRSQILLKGYSQRTIAGLNLTNRLSGATESVTSRTSLSGSDLLISDSSKSFMQYDLPRSKEPCYPSMADRIREGKTYEEQFETSLRGNGSSDGLFQSSEGLPNNDKLSFDRERIRAKHCGIVGVEIDVGLETNSGEKSKRDAYLFGKPSIDNLIVDNYVADIKLEDGSDSHGKESNIDSIIDQLKETNIDDIGSPVKCSAAIVQLQLSPDSRPIRPLHSASAPLPPSPTLVRQYCKPMHSSAPGREVYPHSMMDRPTSSRLAKRLSSGGTEYQADAEEVVATKKSNIAYTLTFHNEPICVNLRTKSQSVTPEPYSTPLSYNGSPECRKSSPIDAGLWKHSQDHDGRVAFERQCSDDRETSPGYRLAYANVPVRSPTPPRRSLRKNPKVSREKDKLVTANSAPLASEEGEFCSAQSSPVIAADLGRRHKQNGDLHIQDIETEEFITTKNTIEDNLSIEHNKSNPSTLLTNDVSIPSSENSVEDENTDEKPVSKLKRRNTFTLPNKPSSESEQNGEEGKENNDQDTFTSPLANGGQLNNNNILVDETTVKNTSLSSDESQTKSPQSVYQESLRGSSPVTDHLVEDFKTPLTSKGSPTLSKSASSSRIPVRRGLAPEVKQSRIPTMAGHSGGGLVAVSASLRGKKCSAVRGAVGESVAAKLGAGTSPMTDNFLQTERNTIIVKHETILQISPQATSTVCTVM